MNEKFSSICRNVKKKKKQRRRDGRNERPNNGMDAINILFTVSVYASTSVLVGHNFPFTRHLTLPFSAIPEHSFFSRRFFLLPAFSHSAVSLLMNISIAVFFSAPFVCLSFCSFSIHFVNYWFGQEKGFDISNFRCRTERSKGKKCSALYTRCVFSFALC